MARILMVADGGTHSGFGTVAHAIGDRLVRDFGHDIHLLAINWQGDHYPTEMKMYLPTQKVGHDMYGMSRYVEMLGRVMPDAIIFLNDPAVILNCLLNNEWDPERILWRGISNTETSYRPPILAYMPIDGYDSPKSWDLLAAGVQRIAMSHHGAKQMPGAPVVWHGVDTDVFKPIDKRAAKVALGYDPDRFLVLRVDKNSIRKDYPASYKALRPLLRKYPDIDVHFHCRTKSNDGYDMAAVMWNDEDTRERVTFSPNIGGFMGWDQAQLATLYAAADVFISTSWGEGFGLTLLEAIASGTPVVAQDCSAISEVVGPGGLLVRPKGRISVPMGQDQCLPDISAFTATVERLYRDATLRVRLGEQAALHAAQFSWETAAAKFNDLILKAVSESQD